MCECKNKVLVVVILITAFILYLTLFIITSRTWSIGIGFFILIPLITSAIIFGVKGGIAVGIFAHPLNILILYLLGDTIGPDHFQPLKIVGWFSGIIVGGLIGWLRDLNCCYRIALKKLKAANETKDTLFSIISHDLKNPFTTMLNLNDLIAVEIDTMDKTEIKKLLKIQQKASEEVYCLLENLLDWARTQSDNIICQPVNLNISQIIIRCISLLEGQSKSKNVKIINKINKEMKAFADRHMITTVFRNLISNAIKFTHENGCVEIFSKTRDSHVEIMFKDNGIGISSDLKQNIFNGGFTSQPGTKNEKGTGIGLKLCYEFVTLNNGRISVESEIEKGSIFTITLPISSLSS